MPSILRGGISVLTDVHCVQVVCIGVLCLPCYYVDVEKKCNSFLCIMTHLENRVLMHPDIYTFLNVEGFFITKFN